MTNKYCFKIIGLLDILAILTIILIIKSSANLLYGIATTNIIGIVSLIALLIHKELIKQSIMYKIFIFINYLFVVWHIWIMGIIMTITVI